MFIVNLKKKKKKEAVARVAATVTDRDLQLSCDTNIHSLDQIRELIYSRSYILTTSITPLSR